MRVFLKPMLVVFAVFVLMSGAAVRVGKDFSAQPFHNEFTTVYDRRFDQEIDDTIINIRLIHVQSGHGWTLIDEPSRLGTPLMRWSPNDEWLFFDVNTEFGDLPVIRVHWSGQPLERINGGGSPQGWQLSPDNQWLAWLTPDDVGYSLYVAERDGSHRMRLQEHIPLAGDSIVYWSPNSEWMYVIRNMKYGEGNQSHFPLELYRIRPDGTDFEKLASVDNEHLNHVDVSDEYIVLSTVSVPQPSGSQEWKVYSLELDDYTLSEITNITDLTESDYFEDFHLTSDAIVFWRHESDWQFTSIRYDFQTGQVGPWVSPLENGNFFTASQIRWSASGNHFDIYGWLTNGVYVRLVSDSNGQLQTLYRSRLCNLWIQVAPERESFWHDETLYFFDRVDEDTCNLVRVSNDFTEATVIREFPQNARRFKFKYINDTLWITYNDNGATYLTNLDGSVRYRVKGLTDDNGGKWVEIPIRERDYRLAIVVGIGCIGVTLAASWILRRKQQ